MGGVSGERKRLAFAAAPADGSRVRFTAESGHGLRLQDCRRRAIRRQGASQQTTALFDHFVGGGEQLFRDGEAKRLCSLEIDDELKFSWQLHW
jgi:hypothetical protein